MTCQLRRLLPGIKAHDDARTELAATRAELDRVRQQWAMVRHFVALFDHHLERNGFSERIADIYRGGKS